MVFSSLQFLVFFPVVTMAYFALPHKLRWFFLLAASCYFYMAFIPVYILILLSTIVVDYLAGILIEQSAGRRRKLYLVFSILSTCAILFVFKYFNFFSSNVAAVAQALHLPVNYQAVSIILPIGLSFHTFQSLSYVIEVYRGNQKSERNFGIYALYVMFYPQLVAGPIERPQNLLHQFRTPHAFDYRRVVDGLRLMLWGLFKKVVIADRLAVFVNAVYNHPTEYSGISLILATVFFAFQIYCDFSGYSDIAIGAAQVMGFRLMYNFNRPYFSKSVAEFWKRWHISLSTWFKDYVYISLGGNRVRRSRWYFNLLVTFLISGLWHGANWTFVIWGALNGGYQVVGLMTRKLRQKVRDACLPVFARFRLPLAGILALLLVAVAAAALSQVILQRAKSGEPLTISYGLAVDEDSPGHPRLVMESPGRRLQELKFKPSGAGLAASVDAPARNLYLLLPKTAVGDRTALSVGNTGAPPAWTGTAADFTPRTDLDLSSLSIDGGDYLAVSLREHFTSGASVFPWVDLVNWAGDRPYVLRVLKYLALLVAGCVLVVGALGFANARFRKRHGQPWFPRFSYQYVQVAITFSLICFAWIFFRARTLPEALYIVGHLFDFKSKGFSLQAITMGQKTEEFLFAVGAVVFLEFIHLIQRHSSIRQMLAGRSAALKWGLTLAMTLAIILFGKVDLDNNSFIYFQF